jgi:Leucine-rich repeat (LRR) protein
MFEHWQSFYLRLKDKYPLEEIKKKYKRLLLEFEEKIILLSQMTPAAGPCGEDIAPISLPTGSLYYSPIINTLNWFTGNNYGGIAYNNISLNNFNLGVDPVLVRSLSFNTSSGNTNQIEVINNLQIYSNLNTLDIHNQNLSELSNITGSFNLAKLDCSENIISSLDVTQNSLLYYLDCQANLLENLDVTENTLLTRLNSSFNQLYNIDLTQNNNLQELYLSNNQFLSSLNLSGNSQLVKLNCAYNQITSLDLSQTTNLVELYCNNNVMTLMNFSVLDTLEIIECQNNRLATVNLSGNNASLRRLVCSDQFNQLSNVVIGNKPNLTYLACTNNPNLITLSTTGCLALEYLYLDSNPIINPLDLSYNTLLKELSIQNSNISSLDLLNNIDLKTLYLSNNALQELDIQNSDKLNDLDLSGNELNSVTMSVYNNSTENSFSFNFSDNNLSASAVNYILETLDGYDNVSGTLTLDLTQNVEGPSGSAAITHLNSLITRGWNVTTVTPYPMLNSFSPSSGNVGSNVVLSGAYFTGTTSVKFNGIAATSYTVNSSTQITATVPVGATSGKIRITTPTGYVVSNTNYAVNVFTPVITSFTPTAGLIGSSVVISGDYFNNASSVTFNGVSATFTINSNSQITATVPSGVSTGPIAVTTPSGTGTSATNYDPVLAPSISSFTPISGFVGTQVQITGSEFTTVSSVRFNNITSSYTLVSDTGIRATVPSTATSGFVTVITSGGTASSSPDTYTVTVPTPTITSFSPGTGSVGTSVTITGTNLLNTSEVTFRGLTSSFFTVNSSTNVVAAVPVGYNKSGLINLTTPGGVATSSLVFVYSAPSARLSYTPITSALNWYDGENYGGTASTNVSLNDFQNNVTPNNVYTIEFLDDANITSISNLSTYTNLKTLDVTFQNLSSLNLTGNGSIKQLYCDNNDLTSLDLSNNNVITILSCDNNLLTSLNVTNMTALSTLSFISCALPSISLTTNTNLKYLEANNNQLSTINLNNNTSLLTVDVSENLLTSISLSNNTALQVLNVGTNALTGALNLSANTSLTELNCESNTLSSITGLSSLTNLLKLTISNNSFTTLDISNNTNLVDIYAAVNNITSVTLSSSPNITTTYHLDLSNNSLTEAAVNYILQTVNGYTTPSGTNMSDKFIDISGGTNATPTGVGITALNSLLAKGYTIVNN